MTFQFTVICTISWNWKDFFFLRFGKNYVYMSSDWKENLAFAFSVFVCVLIVSIGFHFLINYVHRKRQKFWDEWAENKLKETTKTANIDKKIFCFNVWPSHLMSSDHSMSLQNCYFWISENKILKGFQFQIYFNVLFISFMFLSLKPFE